MDTNILQPDLDPIYFVENGVVIDDNKIIEIIETTEKAAVFKAEHQTLKRLVALKLLHPQYPFTISETDLEKRIHQFTQGLSKDETIAKKRRDIYHRLRTEFGINATEPQEDE
ncbi:hypothetical protein CL622_04005 [archaeon]|mgnify:CR=1 FL=1|nr:hypothetical protein [archaeon]